MNKQIIEKLIKLHDESCPEFTYTNPLLDKNVTRAVSKSIVKNLYRNNRIKSNQNVRTSLLQTVRNMCKSAPKDHVEIDEDLTEVLTSFYAKQLEKATATKNIDKQLDEFLIRKSKLTNLNTSFEPTVNPEVIQALLNLNENIVYSENITKDIVHWDYEDQKCKTVLQNLWSEDALHETSLYEDISIRMKSKLENILLTILHRLLEKQSLEHELFSDHYLNSLVNTCAISAECFQICSCILNSVFITSGFNNLIEKFIITLIQNVKLKAKVTIAVLYPVKLSNLVTVLDFDLDTLPVTLRDRYVKLGIDSLKTLHDNLENDLIMLLSHFPRWFSVYFDT